VAEQHQKISPDLAIEHEIQRQMLKRLNIEWTPGEPFYSVIEVELERLRQAGLKLAARSATESMLLQAKVRRLTTLTDQLADTINKRQSEVEELRAALKEALAQNERFNTRYRDSEADNERLEEQANKMAGTLVVCTEEIERLRAQVAARENYAVTLEQRAMRAEAEVERLKADPVVDGRLAYLESQNKRLRTALEAMDQAMAGHPIYEMSALQRQVQSLLAQT